VIDIVLDLVTVSNSVIFPFESINLAFEPTVKPVPVIVKVAVASASVAFVGDIDEIVGPACFRLLLNIFLRVPEEVS